MPVLRYWNAATSTWVDIGGGGPTEVHVGTAAPVVRDQRVLWVDTDEVTLSNNYFTAVELSGPWNPAYSTWALPFKADVLVNWSATWFSPAGGLSAVNLYLDGTFQGYWAQYFFNEASSHKPGSTSIVVRGMAAGNHTWGIGHATNATSDTNDRAHLAWTCVAVP